VIGRQRPCRSLVAPDKYLSLTTSNSCPNDLPSSKETCSSCTLDAHVWCSSASGSSFDEYAGNCIAKTADITNGEGEDEEEEKEEEDSYLLKLQSLDSSTGGGENIPTELSSSGGGGGPVPKPIRCKRRQLVTVFHDCPSVPVLYTKYANQFHKYEEYVETGAAIGIPVLVLLIAFCCRRRIKKRWEACRQHRQPQPQPEAAAHLVPMVNSGSGSSVTYSSPPIAPTNAPLLYSHNQMAISHQPNYTGQGQVQGYPSVGYARLDQDSDSSVGNNSR